MEEPSMEIVDPRIDPRLVPSGSRAVVIAEHQPEYRDLPSVRTPNGQVITRWALTEKERRAIMFGEDIYVTILSHGAINPLFVTVGPVNWNERA
jgi:dihydrofolate reductase